MLRPIGLALRARLRHCGTGSLLRRSRPSLKTEGNGPVSWTRLMDRFATNPMLFWYAAHGLERVFASGGAADIFRFGTLPAVPSEKHLDEALPSYCQNQLAERAEGERQGKHCEHDRQKGRFFHREEGHPACFGKSEVPVTHERDSLLYVIEDHGGHEVKASVGQCAVN